MQQAFGDGAQQVGFGVQQALGAGAQQVALGAQHRRDRFTLQQRTLTLQQRSLTLQQRSLQRLNILPQRSLQRFKKLPLNNRRFPQQVSHVLQELQQVLGAGAQQAGLGVQQARGAGAQQVGLGVQHFFGAGAQQVALGAGAQQPFPKKLAASTFTPAQQTTARAAT